MKRHSERATPRGLKRRKNRDGSLRLYWTCSERAATLGFSPKIVPVHDIGEDHLRAFCEHLDNQMNAWVAEQDGADRSGELRNDFKNLFRQYRTRPSSPFHRIKANTRKTYSQAMDQLEDVIGGEELSRANIDWIWDVYNEARYPNGKRGPDHVRKAHGFVSMLRKVVAFGVRAEIPDCARIHAILDTERFPAPKPRKKSLGRGYVLAIIEAAKGAGRMSLALGTAIQFECGFRQRDVIGEWGEADSRVRSPYLLRGRQWVNGLQWTDIKDGVLTKTTTKTGSVVTHDMLLLPLTSALIADIPVEQRVFGPMILDEATGRPYAEHAYAREWRKVARAAGVPDDVWNMDARSGAATEADEAGAAPEDIQRTLGHADVKTTMRYIRSEGLERTRRVAKARMGGLDSKE
jgi:integrase